MKYRHLFSALSLLVILTFPSCKKQGCTDCNATNYNSDATEDDGSCVFNNTELLGAYAVSDSIFGPPAAEWEQRSYTIVVQRGGCNDDFLRISNYANKNNNFSGVSFRVECRIEDNNFVIFNQSENGVNVRNSIGSFSNDSIQFEFEYANEFGEVFLGDCWGLRE